MRNHNIGSDGVLFDVDSDQTNDILVPVIFDAESVNETAGGFGGTIDVTVYDGKLITSGAQAFTLPDGLVKGQLKRIQMITDGGDGTLTITSPVDASHDVIVFADVGDTLELIWNGTAWRILAEYNCADGTSSPAIS